MKNTNLIKKSLSLLAITGALVSCSHTPAIQEYATSANPHEEVAKFEADINTAINNQVNVLAPTNFFEAQESLSDSKQSLQKQGKQKATLHKVAQGRAYLNQANEFAQISHRNIEDVIVARREAIAAGAPTLQDKEFRKADKALIEVTSNFEQNKLEDAVLQRSPLQLAYLDLELRAIKQSRLGQAREIITQSKNEGAQKFAPRSFAIAEKSYKDTEAYITANRHDDVQISTRSADTLKVSNHLLKITRDSKSGKKTSSEEMALRMEGEQTKVSTKQDQLNKAQGQLNDTQDQLDVKRGQLVRGEKANQALAAANSDLESEQVLNKRYEEARAEFSKEEAEVYKQGNTLMIRLRGLEFPVSQAVLKGSNFPLLAKVQKVITSFGNSDVVIEGHTDSSGGKALNERLSSDRAEAVKEYLVSNNTTQVLNIKAIGYGYQKPLATNKTANGRAQNRRVDVLIHPDDPSTTITN